MGRYILQGLIFLARWTMQGVYDLLCLRRVRDRVCFFSRQSDTPSIDFTWLQRELARVSPETEQVTICHRYRNGRDGTLCFALDQLRSMYYLATSRTCVLDAYWPAVSMLRLRKELKVIQIWHSVGKIKRSGYQTLGMAGGRDAKLARALRMHRNYDYIISGGSAWDRYYCEAFDTTPDKLRHYGLPRLDWLLAQDDPRGRLEEKYPELRRKEIVLYAPTYRKYPIAPQDELSELFSGGQYALICRFHPNQHFDEELPARMHRYDEEKIFALLKSCDYLITDYSSLALEGAALGKKTFYYLFDHDRYLAENGLNIDPAEEMPGCSFETAAELFWAVESGRYPADELRRYQERFLPGELGRSTRNIVSLITGKEQKKDVGVLELV